MYLGIGREQPSTTAAVDATAGQVLLYRGAVADDLLLLHLRRPDELERGRLGAAKPLPYLVSVPDPYDVISPFHDWGPVPVTAPDARQGPPRRRYLGRRDDGAEPVRPRLAARADDAEHARAVPAPDRGRREHVGARSGSARRGSTSACCRSRRRCRAARSLYGSTVQLSGRDPRHRRRHARATPVRRHLAAGRPDHAEADGHRPADRDADDTHRLPARDAAGGGARTCGSVTPVVTLSPPSAPDAGSAQGTDARRCCPERRSRSSSWPGRDDVDDRRHRRRRPAVAPDDVATELTCRCAHGGHLSRA